jgi:hypothetical protein
VTGISRIFFKNWGLHEKKYFYIMELSRNTKEDWTMGKHSWIVIVGLLAIFSAVIGNTGVRTVSADPKAFDYLLPEADSHYYTEKDLADMSLQVLCYAKNEIYARHGRMFISKELTEYFELQPWYYGTVEPADFSDSDLNKYEIQNIQMLVILENKIQAGGYKLDQDGYSFDEIDRYVSGRNSSNDAESYKGIAKNYTYDEEERIATTDCLTLTIPEEWDDNFGVANATSDSLEFYCTLVREQEGYGGTLCTICRYSEYESEDEFPSAVYLGESNGYYYYFMTPTDVQFNPEDDEGTTLYKEMEEEVENLQETIQIL